MLERQGRFILLIPLTREQADEKHRTRQDYALVTRLGSNLLMLRHHTGRSPHDPEQPRNPHYVPSRSFLLDAYGPGGRLLVCFEADRDRVEVMTLQSIDVWEPISSRNIWYAFNHAKKRKKTIYDYRERLTGYDERTMTDSDVALCEFPDPPFGEFMDLVDRTSTFLKNEGFGVWFDHAEQQRPSLDT